MKAAVAHEFNRPLTVEDVRILFDPGEAST